MIELKIAFRNLFRYYKNNIIIAIIIIFSITLSVLFSFFYKGLTTNLLEKIREIVTGDYYITTQLGNDHPGIFSRNFEFFDIPEKIITYLDNHSSVKLYTTRTDFYGQLTTGKQSFISRFQALEPEKDKGFLNNFKIIKGRNLSTNYNNSEVIISNDIVKDYEINVGDNIRVLARTESGLLREKDFIIVGIFNSKLISAFLEQYIYLRSKDADKLLKLNGNVTRLNIYLKKDYTNFNDFIDFFQNNIKGLELNFWKKGTSTFIVINIVFIFTYLSFVIITAILMASSISISIIMTISERIREISIFSALGGTKKKIVKIFMLEYIFLSFFCAVFAFFLALFFFFIISITGVYIPDKNLAFMVGGRIFYPAWDNYVFLTGLLWPILITIISAFFTSLKSINIKDLNN